ncbi:ABC transporter permease [Nocardia sp. NEAU-G5]|uniref:Transport permease protein n=1 Tax=Nocardia albiluteola TaxID=2842303 RepID=A0ABS6BAR7_9NOCA|nr:ABC transporter permease [Nocardia albiluteola]MBU3066870.1 ABC transporter permease [Nocardia albiluteola]
MTTLSPAPSGARLAWALSDYWEMAQRSLRHIRHDPEQLINVTLQPVLTVILMNYLLGGAISTGGHEHYIDYVMPGILIVAIAFAAITTTTSVAADVQDGVVDRFRTLPIAKSSVIAGHVVADLVRGGFGVIVTVGVGIAIGFRPHADIGEWVAAAGLLVLVALGMSWLAALIGLLGRSPEVTQQLAALIILPVFFSSALVPTDTMPRWLRVVLANQPVTQAVDALRKLLLNQPAGNQLWLALVEFGTITVIGGVVAGLLFQRRTR